MTSSRTSKIATALAVLTVLGFPAALYAQKALPGTPAVPVVPNATATGATPYSTKQLVITFAPGNLQEVLTEAQRAGSIEVQSVSIGGTAAVKLDDAPARAPGTVRLRMGAPFPAADVLACTTVAATALAANRSLELKLFGQHNLALAGYYEISSQQRMTCALR
jgi:hypothetical protein